MPGNIVNLTPETIATWPTPNYVDPVERSWMPIYGGLIYGFSSLLIALRLWLRLLKQAGGLGLDDALLAFAWFGSSMFTIVLILSTVVYHTGRHAWDIPLQNFESIAQLAWLAQFSSLVTGCATKVSVLCFYRRLVAGTYSRRWKWAVIIAILFTVAWTLVFIFMLIFNCRPTEAYWKSFDLTWDPKYQCSDTSVVNLLAGFFAAASDLYAVALPCFMTRHFQLPRRQKIALNLIFCLGLVVVVASGVRTYYLYQVGVNDDVSWMIFDAYIFAHLELQLSIICASLPALRVFLRRYFTEPFSRASGQRSSDKSPGPERVLSGHSGPVNIQMISSPIIDEQKGAYFATKEVPRDSRMAVDSRMVVDSRMEGDTRTVSDQSQWEPRSRSPSVPSEAPFVRGLYTSESWNHETVGRYEGSMHTHEGAEFERVKSSRGRNNFSQPRPRDGTFYDGS